jgi:hypothetical protein
MAIKKLTFSFEVPITQLLGLIATGNTGLKIDVLGDDRPTPQKRLNHHNGVKLLEAPKQSRVQPSRIRSTNGKPSWISMLEAFAKNPEHTKSTTDLGKLLVANGLSAKSVSPQLSMMQGEGFVTRTEPGVYRLTAKGLREAIQRGFGVARKPPKKKKPAAVATPEVAESNNG